MASFDFPLQFKRQFEGPMDFHAEFSTTLAREQYLNDNRRYAGMVVYDKQTSRLYILNSAKDAWLEVPTSSNSSEIRFTAGELTVDNLKLDGNTLSSSTGDIVLSPAGSDVVPASPAGANLGTSGTQWNNLWIDGTANIDSLVADTADIDGGSVDGVTIGTNSVATEIRVDQIKLDSSIVTTIGINNLVLNTNEGTNSGNITITQGADADILITPNGDGDISLDGQLWPRSAGSTGTILSVTDNATGQLGWISIGSGGGGVGDVSFSGTAPITDNSIARFDLTTGKLIQATGVTVNDSDEISGVAQLTVDQLTLNGSTISTTADNNIILAPGGTGTVQFPTQNANNIFAGPTTGAAAVPTFRSLVAADIPDLDASKITTGTLPIARGGTNSGTALTDNRVMVSNSGKIVVASEITASRALKSDSNGIPTHFDTATEPSLSELSHVKGVTSAIQTQINNKPSKFTTDVGDASNTTFTITHNLNTRDIIVQVYENTFFTQIIPTGITRTSTTQAVITFGATPGVDEYKVIVIG